MTTAIREVGDDFRGSDLFLPDLVGAADATATPMLVIEEEIKRVRAKHESLGNVVIGTVICDIHNIGNIMVATMLVIEGGTVHDAGINVPANAFPDIATWLPSTMIAMR